MNTTRGFSGLLVVLIIALLAGGVFWYFEQNKTISTTDVSGSTPTAVDSKNETASWKEYSNASLGLSFKYPSDWEIVNEMVSMPPVIAVSPVGYDSPRNPGAFHIYRIIDDGSSNESEEHKLDSGWSGDGKERMRHVDTKDQRYRVIMVGGSPELESTNEQILSTFVYKP